MIESPAPNLPAVDDHHPLHVWRERVPTQPAGPRGPTPSTRHGSAEAAVPDPLMLATAKWSWASRILDPVGLEAADQDRMVPRAGDLALVRIDSVGYHTTLVTADNRKLRIYPGDLVVGVFGHRYATDAYEAEADSLSDLSLLTAGGMVGRILSRHRQMGKPTTVTFLGYLNDPEGKRANLKERRFRPVGEAPVPRNLIVVVGTGMNAGKTTVASQLIHALAQQGLRVAALKLTGSVSNRDQDEMRAAAADDVRDFSDYGFPSTYLASGEELRQLWATMLADSELIAPDATVMEIADGILQRETEMILGDPTFRSRVRGVLLAADSALGALAAVGRLRAAGYPVIAVSGALTSSPLYVREFSRHSSVPVASSAGDGQELGGAVRSCLGGPPAGNGVPTSAVPSATRPRVPSAYPLV